MLHQQKVRQGDLGDHHDLTTAQSPAAQRPDPVMDAGLQLASVPEVLPEYQGGVAQSGGPSVATS
jgi:hypothetical protein